MNAGIILQSRQPDFVNALARGHAAGREALKSDVFREHGAAAINGDQKAQNALACFDPTLSQGIQGSNQLTTHADENQSFNREKMTMLRSDHARRAQAIVAQMSATERKQTTDRLNGVLLGPSLSTKRKMKSVTLGLTQFEPKWSPHPCTFGGFRCKQGLKNAGLHNPLMLEDLGLVGHSKTLME